MRRLFWLAVFLTLCPTFLFSQEQEDKDSLVRLMSATKARLVEQDGKSFRKFEGSARFLHNNTYLNCDTALWNVEDEYIDALRHVQIIQENTILSGDKIHYIINDNLAQFRGSLVQLVDRDNNTLRTHYLDYNTKDSVATFIGGAGMKDKDGNIIESQMGSYDSKANLFTFIRDVEMFSDSLFFVSDTMRYFSKSETARFGKNTRGWKGDNALSAGGGWYNRRDETFFFDKGVYIQTKDYEVWCDRVYYDRKKEYCHLYDNIQILDTANNVILLSDELEYWDNPRHGIVYNSPVLIMLQDDKTGRDSIFIAADTLKFSVKRKCDVDSTVLAAAKERLALTKIDPYANALKNMKASAKSNSSEGQGGQPRTPGKGTKLSGKGKTGAGGPPEGQKKDTVAAVAHDSVAVTDSSARTFALDSAAFADSVARADSIAALPDTTQVVFCEAYHHVLVFKKDLQLRCDSLQYTGIDSIARLYKSPIIWKDITQQLSADSMQLIIEKQLFKKGYLLSNAFIVTEEEKGKYYNQVKSPEMIGYFEDSQLSRFDALGGASAIFYLAENNTVTTMNQKETKIISARLKDGALQRIHYIESIKSDAYPVWGLSKDKQQLKDFKWVPELRPSDRNALTRRLVKSSIRQEVISSPTFPSFQYTHLYYEGYIEHILQEIADRKPLIWKIGK